MVFHGELRWIASWSDLIKFARVSSATSIVKFVPAFLPWRATGASGFLIAISFMVPRMLLVHYSSNRRCSL